MWKHTNSKITFTIAKNKFDELNKNKNFLEESIVPVNGKFLKDIKIKNEKGKKIEEYYKWQFIFSLIQSGLYPKDYVGVEIFFPKGNKNAEPIKIDFCIFDDKEWLDYYHKWREKKDQQALEFLRNHCIVVGEFKKDDGKDIEVVFNSQIKAYIKEPDTKNLLGIYYDKERLYLFLKENGEILRYDDSKNKKQKSNSYERLSLDLTDSYLTIPSFKKILEEIKQPEVVDRENRTIEDLDIIASISETNIRDAMSNILKTLDLMSLSQIGYEILIQTIALKIFDEKRNQKNPNIKLQFFINEDEKNFVSLNDKNIQKFIKRMNAIYEDASDKYQDILKELSIKWKNENHVNMVISIVENFQDYSFVRSEKSDLYQLVFNNFARPFQKLEKAQFLTPLPIIDFLTKIVNPRGDETILDPTVGIADFLSISYVNSESKLDDNNLYGMDNDESMIKLAKLNMLLNGDGNAHLFFVPDKGSIIYKMAKGNKTVQLIPEIHKNGNWETWGDKTKLMKFDVILTNPPFGRGRQYEIKSPNDKKIIEMYETWNLFNSISAEDIENEDTENNKKKVKSGMDKGIIFLENAYRCLDENGRFGIVLSNSIASIKTWKIIRKWLMEKTRIVALFDLPKSVFAENDVNTTLIVAYKPSKIELDKLKKSNYRIFVRDIKKVGQEKKTEKRNVVFKKVYKINPETFEVEMDENGNPVIDEEFSQIIKEFREWTLIQEETLQKLFIEER